MDNTIIKNLLIPLDGSKLAESVLPYAAQVAKKLNVSVTLLHIIETDAPEKVHGQQHLTKPAQAEKYLNSISSLEIFKYVGVEFHVHEMSVKDVAKSISEHSQELQQDLVVLCTHGSSGIHHILFGSIAQQVISLGTTPVLLVNSLQVYPAEGCKLEKFLIPLDGNPDHEHVLDYAVKFAKLCGAAVHLFVAIPRFGNMSGEFTQANRLLPGTTSRMMDMIVADAEEYLTKLKVKMELSGLKVSSGYSRNDPADAITVEAKKNNADLIILATHGKKGAEAFWEGSITPKISKSSKIPLLLVPVRGNQEAGN